MNTMDDLNKIFEPQSEAEENEFAIEDLVFQVQLELHRAMLRCGIDQAQLAARIGVTPARISQIFSKGGPNLTLKTIGRILHALGKSGELRVDRPDSGKLRHVKRVEQHRVREIVSAVIAKKTWNENFANDNHGPSPMAA